MTTNQKIKSDIQRLSIGSELVDLYSIDATALGGSVSFFTPAVSGGSNLVFNNVEYIQLPVEITGLESTGDGRLPRPRLKVSNINLTFIAFINAYNDGLGAKVTRLRTFKRYLDDQVDADPSAIFPTDVFYIEQKLSQNKYTIEWELVTPVDFGNRFLPKNQVLQYCQHRYGLYTDGAFDYSIATCPYTGTGYFKYDGTSTTAANDMCGKKLFDCKLRYTASGDQLPFKGFPVVGQVGAAYK